MQKAAVEEAQKTVQQAEKAVRQATCQHENKTVQNRDVVPAGCETDGSHTEVTLCLDCELELDSRKVMDTALGHNYTAEVTTPATETGEGVRTYTCSHCGDSYTFSIPKTTAVPTEKEQESENGEMNCQPEETGGRTLWLLHFPQNRAVAYKAERTEIGTIFVSDAENYSYEQTIKVVLEYSSFNSRDYFIPVTITSIQNGVEQVWTDGSDRNLKLDGSDPLTVFVNITADAWKEASRGAYEMNLIFKASIQGV